MPTVSKIVLWILGLSVSVPAFAEGREILFPGQLIRIGDTTVECRAGGDTTPICDTAGLDRAKAICNEMPTYDQIDQCLSGLRHANYISLRAASVCREMPTWDQIRGCLTQIADRELSDADVANCRNRPTWDQIMNCLGTSSRAARCSASDDDRMCETAGLEYAKQICNSMPTIPQIDQCLASLRDARFVTGRAVQICREMPTWDAIAQCLAGITNIVYSDVELSGCRNRPTWDGIRACMAIVGRTATCR